MATFNYFKAKEQGFSDEEIVAHLAEKEEGFNYDKALEQGFSNREIIGKLAYSIDPNASTSGKALARGAERGNTSTDRGISKVEEQVEKSTEGMVPEFVKNINTLATLALPGGRTLLKKRTEEDKAEDATETQAKMESLQSELEEALAVIKSLKGTINEVNLLNAKLLYANKLFRGYNLTNEQKVKVVENLDRTNSVREVKLVYATLSESMKFTGTERKVAAVKKNITEGIASKAQASTAPAKEIIAENTNELANRFKQLAGIIK